MDLPASLYVPADDGYAATALTIGPWDPGLPARRAAGRPAAARGRAGQRHRRRADRAAGLRHLRRRCRSARSGSRTSVVRPGRRIELVEAVLTAGDERPLMRLSAWRMRTRRRRRPPAGAAPPTPRRPVRQDSRPEDGRLLHRGRRLPPGAGLAVRHRQLQRARARPPAWTRPQCELVAGEPMTPLQHLLVMTDAASGISAALDWSTTSFANVDLTLALHRPPRGEWLGMDATDGARRHRRRAVLRRPLRRRRRDRPLDAVAVRGATVTSRIWHRPPERSGWNR